MLSEIERATFKKINYLINQKMHTIQMMVSEMIETKFFKILIYFSSPAVRLWSWPWQAGFPAHARLLFWSPHRLKRQPQPTHCSRGTSGVRTCSAPLAMTAASNIWTMSAGNAEFEEFLKEGHQLKRNTAKICSASLGRNRVNSLRSTPWSWLLEVFKQQVDNVAQCYSQIAHNPREEARETE